MILRQSAIERAQAALDCYPLSQAAAAIANLVADLYHLAESEGIAPDDLTRRAAVLFNAEREPARDYPFGMTETEHERYLDAKEQPQ